MLWDRYSSPLFKEFHLRRLLGDSDLGPSWLPRDEEVAAALLFDAIDPSFRWSRERTISLIAKLQTCSPSTVYKRLDAISGWIRAVASDEYERRKKSEKGRIRRSLLVHHHINNMVAL